MTEQTETRIYLGRFDGDRLVDVTHFTSPDDQDVAGGILEKITANPDAESYTDWDGNEWFPLSEGRVTEQRADMGGACCWCEFPQARQKYLPVPASAVVGRVHTRSVVRDPDFWVMVAVSAFIVGVIAAFIVGATGWVLS